MYPRIEIDLKKLRNNIKVLGSLLHEQGLSFAMVTKVYAADTKIVEEVLKENKIDFLADSRIENLKNLKNLSIPKILLRIPMLSETSDVVKFSDISFNSELSTIEKLDEEAKKINKIHKIVIMIDLGDLREGFFYEEDIYKAIEKILTFKNIEFFGVATNLTCYGAVLPSTKNLGQLALLAENIEKKFNINLKFISGGNSSSLDMFLKNKVPNKINNLRLGEAVILGRETAYGNNIPETEYDAFKLVCEIVELKEKPSMPIGERGKDAFGREIEYEDKGIMKRAIIAIGKQDINIENLIPVDGKIEIIGCSSDHTIIDISHSENNYSVGDKLEFLLEYGGILSSFTSKYINKFYKY